MYNCYIDNKSHKQISFEKRVNGIFFLFLFWGQTIEQFLQNQNNFGAELRISIKKNEYINKTNWLQFQLFG